MAACDDLITNEDLAAYKLDAEYLGLTVESPNHSELTPNGQLKRTISGINQDADDAISNAVYSIGFQNVGAWAIGKVVQNAQQTLTYIGEEFNTTAGPFPVTVDASTPSADTEDWFNVTLEARKTVARSLNVLDSQVIYSTDAATLLDNVLYIYDAVTQTTWSIPTLDSTGKTIVSVSTLGALVTTGGSGSNSYQLIAIITELIFNTVSEMLTSNHAPDYTPIKTLGYYSKGDGGGAHYLGKTSAQAITDGDLIDEVAGHTLANGDVVALQASPSMSILVFGVVAGQLIDLNLASAFVFCKGRSELTGVEQTYRTAIDTQPSTSSMSNMTFDGRGMAITKDATSSGGYEMIRQVNDSVLKNITLIGDWETHTGVTFENGHCVLIGGNNNTTSNVECHSAWGDGIYIEGENNTVEDSCYLHHNRRNNVSVIQGRTNTVQGNVIHKAGRRLSDNAVGASPRAGIDLEPNSLGLLFNTIVQHNVIIENDSKGVAATGTGSAQYDTIISKNIFTGNGQAGIGTNFDCRRLIISDNVFNEQDTVIFGKAIDMFHTNTDVQIHGNVFHIENSDIIKGAAIGGATITGNKFVGGAGHFAGFITALGGDNNIVIDGNEVEGTNDGFYIQSFNDGSISNNKFKNVANECVRTRTCNEIHVAHNKMKECASSGTSVGAIVLDNTGTSNMQLVEFNYLFNKSAVYPSFFVNRLLGGNGIDYVRDNFIPFSLTESINCVVNSTTWGTNVPDTY